mgnify:CR=1 FL=1
MKIFLAKAVLGMSETGSSENTVLPWNEQEAKDEESAEQPAGQ